MLRRADFFRKVQDEVTYGTSTGGGLSLFAAVFLFMLFVLEFNSYLSVQRETAVTMDTSTDTKLRISFDITLHNVPCHFASIDLYDVMHTTEHNITDNVLRTRVARGTGEVLGRVSPKVANAAPNYPEIATEHEGHVEGEQLSVDLTADTFDDFVKSHDVALVNFYAPWCIWCQRLHPVWEHTAGLVDHSALFTESIKFGKIDCTVEAHKDVCQSNHITAFPTIIIYRNGNGHSHEHYHGDRTAEAFISFLKELKNEEAAKAEREDPHEIVRSIKAHDTPDAAAAKLNAAVEAHRPAEDEPGGIEGKPRPEGCNIAGSVSVNKVPGTLVFAFDRPGHSVDNAQVNVSHTVNELTFGNGLTPRQKRRLTAETMRTLSTLVLHNATSKKDLETHEHYIKVVGQHFTFIDGEEVSTYTYTANSQSYVDGDDRPSVRFSYDLSPMAVTVTETSMPFYHFLTSVCAIIGGVFTVLGLIDSVVHHSVTALKKKVVLGKHH